MKIPKHLSRALVLGVLLAASISASAQKGTYSNPILPGDYPDPSVVRVGQDYWATATSSEWGPLFPILHSRDLVNWTLMSHVFQKKPEWSTKNYWAPEISFYNGKFYVYYVGRNKEPDGKEGHLHIAVATAEKPTGPWTDHGPLIGQDEGSIDPVTALSETGDHYLLWKNDGNSRNLPTFIYAQKLSDDGTKLVGEMKQLLRNDAAWEGNLIEGPFAFKRAGWFYIFYAGNGCCGKHCTYGTGVARSKSLLGPYEKFSGNPILAANEKWKCPGHGSIVSTPDGRDYFMYHAYDTKDFVYVGRQGMLDEIKWNEDGWPGINGGKGPSTNAVAPFTKSEIADPEFLDDFTSDTLLSHWQWPHSVEPAAKIVNRELVLISPAERGNELFGSVVAVQAVLGNYAATTVIDTREMKAGTKAGLFAFGDTQNALGIALGDGKVTLVRRQKNKLEILASIDAPKLLRTYLRMEAKEGHLFGFSVWTGRDWKSVGESTDVEGDYLPPWDRGVRVALTVGGVENGSAKFDWLRVAPKTAQQTQ